MLPVLLLALVSPDGVVLLLALVLMVRDGLE